MYKKQQVDVQEQQRPISLCSEINGDRTFLTGTVNTDSIGRRVLIYKKMLLGIWWDCRGINCKRVLAKKQRLSTVKYTATCESKFVMPLTKNKETSSEGRWFSVMKITPGLIPAGRSLSWSGI